MLKNYFKIALRNLLRHKAYSFINIAGLAVGMACCMLILLFVEDELSFDSFHQKKDRIYRLIKTIKVESGEVIHTAESSGNMAPTMRRDYPEVAGYVRLRPWWTKMLISYEDKACNLDRVIFADSSFFQIFDFALIRGEAQTVLNEPQTVVLTEEIAQQFFGNDDPIGKVMVGLYGMPLKVTGIARPAPRNSHLQYNVLISWATTTASPYAARFEYLNNWLAQTLFTYLLLRENADPAALQAKLPPFMQKYMPRFAEQYHLYLQPLRDIHLRSAHIQQNQYTWKAGNITYVYVFAIVAVLILMIACINFMNLSTARAARRAKEVGLRKVLGAYRQQLIRQFLGESILFSVMALFIALVLVEISLPRFNALANRSLGFDLLGNPFLFSGTVLLALFVGFIAGSYPAFVLSAFQPVMVLKGSLQRLIRGALSRQVLVIAQFFFSVALVVATTVVYRQMHFMQSKPLGFDREQVVILKIDDTNIQKQFEVFKTALRQNPSIIGVTAADGGPGLGTTGYDMLPEGEPEERRRGIPMLGVDDDYIATYGMQIIQGRNFSQDYATDSLSILINETLRQQIGWKNPLGKKISVGTTRPIDLTVVGVVKDFHTQSLHQKIEPLLIYFLKAGFSNSSIRLAPHYIPATLNFIKQTWQSLEPKHPFEYTFLDENFARFYESEQRLRQTLEVFSLLAIFISGLGLFGLASYMAQQRTKEIGIRKVLGASVAGIIGLLSKDFVKLVLVANLLAWPLAWFAMNKWLQNFAYRIDLGWWMFALAGGMALLVALLTVSTQAIRAALANPVEALRYE